MDYLTKFREFLNKEALDNIDDKEAETKFKDLKDKDIDNDGDVDDSDSYLHKKLGVVAKKTEDVNEDLIMSDEAYDDFYELISKYVKDPDDVEDELDRFDDGGFSAMSNMVIANLERDSKFKAWKRKYGIKDHMGEMSTTAGVPGYQTPNAFSKSGEEDENDVAETGDMKKVESQYKRMINQMMGLNEASYREFKKDPTSTPQQKVNRGINEVNKMLGAMEKIVNNNLRLKTEMGVQSNHFWKSTGKRFSKINERMTRIANRLKELSQWYQIELGNNLLRLKKIKI